MGAIRRRVRADGSVSYQLIVYWGLGPDGREIYVRRTIRVRNRREAERALKLFESEVLRARITPAGSRTLAELWDRYWRTVAPGLSPSTRAGYWQVWRGRIKGRFGNMRLDGITPQVLEEYYAELRRRGGTQGEPLSPATVRNAHVLISALLSTAVRWEWLPEPHAAKRTRAPKVEQASLEAPETDVVQALLRRAREAAPDLALYVRIAAISGARRGEVAALRWIHFDDTGVDIVEALKVDEHRTVTVGAPKLNQRRRIGLDPVTIEMFAEHRQRSEQFARDAGGTFDPCGFVFTSSPFGDTPVKPDTWTKRWGRLRGRVPGAEGVRLHDLRHYVATEIADAFGLHVAQATLGHSRVSTTGTYATARKPNRDRTAYAIAHLLDDEPDIATETHSAA